jgi:hypothetical protein
MLKDFFSTSQHLALASALPITECGGNANFTLTSVEANLSRPDTVRGGDALLKITLPLRTAGFSGHRC